MFKRVFCLNGNVWNDRFNQCQSEDSGCQKCQYDPRKDLLLWAADTVNCNNPSQKWACCDGVEQEIIIYG